MRSASVVGVFFVLAMFAAGCVAQDDLVGPTSTADDDKGDDGGFGSGDDDPPPPPTDPRFTFAISASAEDPFVAIADPSLGTYDLYLWLICADPGLFLIQSDLSIEGDALLGEGFSPDPGVVGIDWDEYGEFIATLGECDAGPMRLGAFHLFGEGEGVAFNLQSEDSRGRATACGASVAEPFASRGFASDGSEPLVIGEEDGCEADAPLALVSFDNRGAR